MVVRKVGHWGSLLSEVCCWSCTASQRKVLIDSSSVQAIAMFSDETIHDVSDWPYLSFPDTTKITCRCWVLNPVDVLLKEFRFYLLIIHFLIAFLSFASAPMKFIPLSQHISLTGPRLQMKHLNAFINESVSKESASSMCTALLAKQVNKAPYLFTTALPRWTCQGPKKSTPQ